jgi:hypothetical protein
MLGELDDHCKLVDASQKAVPQAAMNFRRAIEHNANQLLAAHAGTLLESMILAVPVLPVFPVVQLPLPLSCKSCKSCQRISSS